MTLIDTAEMYGDGKSEEVVGEPLLVSAIRCSSSPRSTRTTPARRASRPPARAASGGCKPIASTSICCTGRRRPDRRDRARVRGAAGEGKIRAWGVSNFDVAEMDEIEALAPGRNCATDQVLYNPEARGIEFDLLPWCAKRRMPVMAYSPIGQGGRLLRSNTLRAVADRHGVTPAQAAIAWGLRHSGLISIPKAGDSSHVRENAAAAGLVLTPQDLAAIDAAHPPPKRKQSLAML